MSNNENFYTLGKAVIATELRAIQSLHARIDEKFVTACNTLFNCKGRVVVLGVGKSGHIAKKIAATLASTGTPSFYVHPSEASHGDMGMVTPQDVALAISYSGETPEIINLLPTLKRLGVALIALTGKMQSTLARIADTVIDVSVEQEACPLGLAPTSSTTATLVMGDALAIALLEARGFTADDFARIHPGGSLGRRLLLHIADLMHPKDKMPIVKPDCLLDEALVEITKKSLGMTTVVSDSGQLLGVFTDGDLRRTLDKGYDIHRTPIEKVMTKNSITVPPKLLAAEALKMMQQNKITSLVVVDTDASPVGVIHMHDLLRAGVS
ncbi:KpsF/GutQ family sugar-phosphate isomerase [Coxiella burnetii]|uniref:Arabinose 5-phosphate isomerase n=1 Tax=Coxiella burnetii (strain RSA 493 / Nine Mile phase I) TaxID=227377 RepID=Q83DI1_COXBU|nr:KpsF/GutQ family sugar-phosphate isomerase [Coxiella burnetii]NP_819776.1 arabinose-5-phosphate isomerase [Coxiella burnetii RSA 493]AAO90290.1 arabinose-5-phosphate isomerase [Coxiella burnetii RSA 493]ABX77517.1 arabinose-5-phosphate isomerase [Coxiella burnetii RSA 331]ARI65588.1 arabinose-5-phosphate isomerase [Coxiella burnetii]ARK27065.1 D-arabinose 5-phosphate isomerase [Coxiella burnetii]ATN82175.1 D-arabinose 5-phosphate isomerase [Coxiella burnetii]